VPITTVTQTHAPPVSAPDEIKGGTGVMKAFAECPFKAFVRYRLGLTVPDLPSLGLDVVVRGIMVHAVLEAIWKELRTQTALLRLSDSERFGLVERHVSEVLANFPVPEGVYLGGVLLEVEAKRLVRIALQWLKLEAKRSPFVVTGLEEALSIELGGLRLEVRLDRIDETAVGTALVIDYKTGHTDVGQWFGKRIQAPQLPLYCVALAPQAKGVLYGVAKAGKPQLKGTVAEGVGVMEDSKDSRSISEASDWPALVQTWQTTLTQSAADFMAGLATVDPLEGARTCERCAYSAVCRIQARVQAHVQDQTQGDALSEAEGLA
jgi:ATP-dependent helicase/DNAse subunit B